MLFGSFSISAYWRITLKPWLERGKKKAKSLKWQASLPEFNLTPPEPKHLVIFRTDDIGDYILFREALEAVRISARFSDWKITLIGNKVWQELALFQDAAFVNQWVWLDKKLWFNDAVYRIQFLKNLHILSPEMVWIPTRTRHFFLEDTLALAFPGVPKWTSGNEFSPYALSSEKAFVESLNYKPVVTRNSRLHELDFNKEILAEFTGQNQFQPTGLKTLKNKNSGLPDDFIIFFPGASAKSKRWPPQRFRSLGLALFEETKIPILIAGSSRDEALAIEIIGIPTNPYIFINFCGKTKLSELQELLRGARLLVSNDTSAAHMAANQGVPTIAICNGNKFGRFFPYPKRFLQVKAFYPKLEIPLFFEDRYPMKDIDPNVVKEQCLSFLAHPAGLK